MDWPADSNDPPSSLMLNRPSCSTQKKTQLGRSDGMQTPSSTAGTTPVFCLLLSQPTPTSPGPQGQTTDWYSCCRRRYRDDDDDVLTAAWLPTELL